MRSLDVMHVSKRSLLAICIALATCLVETVWAQDYPTRPVRIVSGFGPGSAGDLLARAIGQKLNQSLGQQFIVEHKPGGGSNIAAEYVVRAGADGYTLFVGTSANTINANLSPNLSFDFAKDLAPITLMGSVPNLLAVHPSLGVSNVQELIAAAKSKPDQIHYATSGVGTLSHMSGELLNFLANIKLVHVPYQGSAQALTDVLAGRVPVTFAPVNIVWPHVEAGKLKALATTENKRSSVAPDVPTMAEAAALPRYDSAIWYGLMAPASTPRPVINKLSRAVNDALKADDTLALMRQQGMNPSGGGPTVFASYIEADTKKWAEVITALGLRK
jgi:tripartite-type tricarboxylate transporter receptor subunit TctC